MLHEIKFLLKLSHISTFDANRKLEYLLRCTHGSLNFPHFTNLFTTVKQGARKLGNEGNACSI